MISHGIVLSALALAQGVTIQVGTSRDTTDRPVQVISDSALAVRAARDSATAERRRARAVMMTPEHVATAFADPVARSLLEQARVARLSQDSLLIGYSAAARERFTGGMALTRLGRERIFLRYERSARVQWHRDSGARVQITGERTTAPMFGRRGGANLDLGGAPPIPYFPGREPLLGAALARANVSDRDIANPLAGGAEAYYTYATGDSALFRLPGGQTITLRELRVRPRSPSWRALVASLWFDMANGRLVRAVYRFSEPMDIWEVAAEDEDGNPCDAPRVICAAMNPMTADVPVVTVEYGLHEGRFWLPRSQMVEGSARVGIVRVPFKMEQSYTYDAVNGEIPVAPVIVAAADTARDSLSRARRVEARRAECDGAEYRERVLLRFDNTLPVAVRVPCDTLVLVRSPDLPGSPFDEGEELFGSAERDELVAMALALADQVRGGPQRPVLTPWLQTVRYNRVEGLSGAVAARQSLGSGYTARGELRLSWADRQVNGELGVARSDGRRSIGVGVYRRLAAANDWEDPFGFGSSVSAFLFGRDEGFYYRTLGAELTREPIEGRGVYARAFIERHDSTGTEASASLARLINGRRFRPNINASEGTIGGGSLRWLGSRGLDPRGFRALSDLRIEAAAGEFDYTRASAELTVSRGFGNAFDGALTAAGGTSGGTPPVQRWWFLGGAHTVRGQPAGALSGNSFWLGRAEVGTPFVLARPVAFADIGWAGDRSSFGNPGKPISGAGIGVSFLDGMIRFDLAKGIHPTRTVRGYLYLEARF
ncbi:MAG TPA: ShlB/FhaC/HecB family hemolysin secretion/activation protein [Gemmatimonadaceae bacterium]|nr:ShlB/FhaC/HecB family hemolysin secretion/activation protein [Gemmatimonadaceae bacterium]